MTTQSSVFKKTTSTEFLTYDQIQEKYKECSTKHKLTEAKNKQATKIYGCEQCKVYFFKTADGWNMQNLQESQHHLFGFKEEIIFNKEDEAKAQVLEAEISKIPKGQSIEITKEMIGHGGILDLYNFVTKYKDHKRFENAEMETISGNIKITKK